MCKNIKAACAQNIGTDPRNLGSLRTLAPLGRSSNTYFDHFGPPPLPLRNIKKWSSSMKLASTFWLKMAKISFIFFQLSTISGEKNRPGLKLVISEKILGNKFLKKIKVYAIWRKNCFWGLYWQVHIWSIWMFWRIFLSVIMVDSVITWGWISTRCAYDLDIFRMKKFLGVHCSAFFGPGRGAMKQAGVLAK